MEFYNAPPQQGQGGFQQNNWQDSSQQQQQQQPSAGVYGGGGGGYGYDSQPNNNPSANNFVNRPAARPGSNDMNMFNPSSVQQSFEDFTTDPMKKVMVGTAVQM